MHGFLRFELWDLEFRLGRVGLGAETGTQETGSRDRLPGPTIIKGRLGSRDRRPGPTISKGRLGSRDRRPGLNKSLFLHF